MNSTLSYWENYARELRREKIIVEQWRLDRPPLPLGKNFLVITSWQREDVQESDQIPLIIDPGVGFPASHCTTNLIVKLVERYWQGGRALDVGTGTGVLAMVAARLVPGATIDAFDIDKDIVEHAAQSLALNHLSTQICLRQATIQEYFGGNYSLIMANLLSPIILQLLTDLCECLALDGRLIISGIPEEALTSYVVQWRWGQETIDCMSWELVRVGVERAGLQVLEVETQDQWIAAVLMRKA
ncbi:MAG: 50S ribosomal protein L11 methyltransferase [Acidobacteriota bacterium]